jgi:hypothetical protein
MPEQLDEEELADWRAGRDAVYQLAALTRITAPGSSSPQSTRIVQRTRRPTSNVDSIMVLRARRGGTGAKYLTLRGGRLRAIPDLLVRSSGCARSPIYADKRSGLPPYFPVERG